MTQKEKRARAATDGARVQKHGNILARLEGDIHLDPRDEARITALLAAIGLAFVLIGAAL